MLEIHSFHVLMYMTCCLLVISTTALNSEEPWEGVSMVKVVSLLAGSVDFKPETEIPPTATQVNGDPKIRIVMCFNVTIR